MVARDMWEWFGHAAHFICGPSCRFHLATKVGDYLVSTVGEYVPDAPVRETLAQSRGITLEGRGDARLADWLEKVGFEEIGYGRKYETMVFVVGDHRCTSNDCGCGLPMPTNWSELETAAYNDAGSATRGHLAICEKYAGDAADEPPPPEHHCSLPPSIVEALNSGDGTYRP